MATAAPPARFVAYYRCSTQGQSRSGLGLDAQREAVARQVAQVGGVVVAAFEEVESGKRDDRPELARALAACRAHRAALIIAKLDRLSRNARFLLSVVEGTGDAGVVFCDLPTVPPGPIGRFLVTQMAAVAELEAGLISQRTREALAAAKARGIRIGNPNLLPGTSEQARRAAAAKAEQARRRAADLAPVLAEIRAAGVSTYGGIARALAARGVPTLSGRGRWDPSTVRRLLVPAPVAQNAPL